MVELSRSSSALGILLCLLLLSLPSVGAAEISAFLYSLLGEIFFPSRIRQKEGRGKRVRGLSFFGCELESGLLLSHIFKTLED